MAYEDPRRAMRELQDIGRAIEGYVRYVSARSGELGGYISSLEMLANEIQSFSTSVASVGAPLRLVEINRRLRNTITGLRDVQRKLVG